MNKEELKEKVKDILYSMLSDFDYYIDEDYTRKYSLYMLDKDPYIKEKSEYYVKRILSLNQPPLIYKFPKMEKETFDSIVENIKKEFKELAKRYNINAHMEYELLNFYLHIPQDLVDYKYDYDKLVDLTAECIIEYMEENENKTIEHLKDYLFDDLTLVKKIEKIVLKNIEPDDVLKEFFNETKNLILSQFQISV